MKTRITRIGTSFVLAGILATSVVSLKAADSGVAEQVTHTPFFPQPLVWVGTQRPGDSESRALLADADVFRNKGVAAGITSLEGFLKRYPDSAWAPAIEVSLAERYRNQGRYSSALARWETAWKATRDSQDPAGQKIAVRSIAGWTRLLASLGEKEQLNALFKELDERHLPLGIYDTTITETREGLAMMNAKPGDAYRCGSFALGHVALALGTNKQVAQKFFDADSPNGGFTISELLALAKSNRMAMVAVRQPQGAELVVPSVVHWKLNHYAAILERKGDLYKVEDPTFGGYQWMTAETIEGESSGDFILPGNKAPASWEKLSQMACSKIYGKGYPNLQNDWDDEGPPDQCDGGGDGDEDSDDSYCNPPASNDGSSSGSSPPNCPECQGDSGSTNSSGMPQWYISEPYTTLWLRDTPLLYHQSDKKWIRLRMSFKGRGEAQNPNGPGFGDKWSCSWLGMIETPSGSTDTVTNFLAGGGVRPFRTDGTPDYKTARWFAEANGNEAVITPTLAQNVYGVKMTYLDGTVYNFPSQRQDRYGRVLQQYYYQTNNGVLQLTTVVDADGQTNTLGYGNANFPNLITSATNRYGATAFFSYDTSGLLTNIVDAQAMSTFFQYDTNEDITNMITLYGTNSFKIYESGNGSNSPLDRAILITEASGDQQLYAYIDNPPTDFADMSSYHWNRAAYAAISGDWLADSFGMPTGDYEIASIKHWLHGDATGSGGTTVSDTMDQARDPFDPVLQNRPNQLSYGYQGQNGGQIGDPPTGLKRVTYISDNSTSMSINRNNLGRPTNYVYDNSDGSTAAYTNFFDPTGMILQYELGPQGELTRGYGYDPAFTNLLVSVTNAMGDVIRYTHDTNTLKVTSVTFPGGMVRTNIYYTNGPSKGFLAVQADIGIRTNYFVYNNGNLFIQTNELGLVTSNIYDNLNRLLSTFYPDGTTVSNIYNKLDIVATKDRLNQWTYFGYNAVRQLVAVTNVNGQITQYAYCGCGSPDQITRWNGSTPLVTTLSYNMGGLVTNAVYPDGYQLSYTYDNQDRVQTLTDGAGNQLFVGWYEHGLSSQPQVAYLGPRTLFNRQFDQYGRVIQDTDANSVTVTNAYDFLDRITARAFLGSDGVTDSGVESFSYNALGLTNYIDQLGHLTTFVRDLAGRVMAETNGNKEVLQFAYNPVSELLTLTDGKNQPTQWGYDQFGRVTNKVDASATIDFVYQYDPDNRLTNRWTPAKGTTVFRYDPIGNLTNVDYSGGTVSTPSISFTYDGVNRLTNMLDGIGTTVFTWTPGNQLAGEIAPWHDSALTYSYNSARQRSSLSLLQPTADAWIQSYTSYDSGMRLQTLVSPAGEFDYAYQYGLDRVYRVTLPGGGNSCVNTYDGLARTTENQLATAVQNPQLQLGYAYDQGSEMTQRVFTANNYINYTYDNIGQLQSAQGFESGGAARLQEQWGYAYDKAWNLNNRTNNGLVQTFAVNNLNELSGVSRSGTLTVAGSTTEPGNSISSVTVNGQGATEYADGTFAKSGFTLTDGQNPFTANAQDTSGRSDSASVTANLPASPSYTYDSNGNLTNDGTRNFAYDDENQLTAIWVANTWSNGFSYDGLLRKRIEKDYSYNGSSWVETNETHFIYDGYLVLQERDANNLPVTTYTRGLDLSGTFQDAGGIGGLLARSDRMSVIPYVLSPGSANSQYIYNSYYFSDALGNVTALVSQNGMMLAQYQYDPYGNMVSMSGLMASANKYRFSSKEWNEAAGLYYYGFRYFDPSIQRWLNRDPIGVLGGINLYVFAGNDAILLIDPFGMRGFLCRAGQFLRGLGATAGGAALILGSEGPWAVATVPSGAIGMSYGIGNMVAAFAPEENNDLANKMLGSPNNLGGAIGRAVGGEKGQAIGSVAETAAGLPPAINNGKIFDGAKTGVDLFDAANDAANTEPAPSTVPAPNTGPDGNAGPDDPSDCGCN